MQLAYPHNAWWFVAVTLVILLAVVALVRRHRALRRLGPVYARSRGWRSAGHFRPVLKAIMRACAVVLLGVAVLGPCLGVRAVPTPPAQGRDLFILLDVSRSMLAEDVLPNRLERAKRGLDELAKHLERRGGYRLGLIAFAERPVLLCPLTTDFRHFREELGAGSLSSVRLRDGGSDVGSGTQLELALERVRRAVPKQTNAELAPVPCVDVLLVSDGGDEPEAGLLKLADEFAEAKLAVHTLGIGDPARDWPIPVTLPGGGRDFLHHEGRQVGTRLREGSLRQIARRTGGLYLAAGTGPLPLDALMSELSVKKTRELSTQARATLPIHRFAWFVLPAFSLLLVENLISMRRRSVPVPVTHFVRTEWLSRIVPAPRSLAASEMQPLTEA